MVNSLSSTKNQYAGEITNTCNFEGLIAGTTSYCMSEINDTTHFHDNPTICFLLHGGGIEKRNQNNYERSACDIRFYHAAEWHQSKIKVFPSKCINLELESHFLNEYEISENIVNAAVTKNVDIKLMMLKIHKELLINDYFTASSIKISLLGMLNDTENLSKQKRPKWIKNLYEILNDRWAEQISLEDLSNAVNVHPTTISKHFTKYFSCTFGEYMRKLKINKSIDLIRNTNLPLTEIASHCGFADQSHFTRNFKKLTGFLPKDFKQL